MLSGSSAPKSAVGSAINMMNGSALVVPAILMMFLVASLFPALGITVASFLSDMQGFQLIMNFLVMPMYFLSGVLVPLTNVPALLLTLATIDPLTYGVDGLRALLIGASHFGVAVDVIVLLAVALVLLGLGSYRFTRVEV